MQWLHECCHVLLPLVRRHAGLPLGAADRNVIASRFLAAAAVRVIYCCVLQLGIVNLTGMADLSAIVSQFWSFFGFGAEIRFWSCNFWCHCA